MTARSTIDAAHPVAHPSVERSGAERSVSEHRRIQEVYRSYEGGRGDGWDTSNAGNVRIERERDEAMVASLRAAGVDGRILDLGCGYGAMLERLVEAGHAPGHLVGAEILLDRCRVVRAEGSVAGVVQLDGLTIPYRSGTFDAALAMTVFSSILDDDVTAAIAVELDRVLRPGGSLHVYDMGIRSPGNPNVRPITARTLGPFFPGYRTTSTSLTVLPPLSRRLGSRAGRWYGPLSRVPLLRSHRLIRMTKPVAAAGSGERS